MTPERRRERRWFRILLSLAIAWVSGEVGAASWTARHELPIPAATPGSPPGPNPLRGVLPIQILGNLIQLTNGAAARAFVSSNGGAASGGTSYTPGTGTGYLVHPYAGGANGGALLLASDPTGSTTHAFASIVSTNQNGSFEGIYEQKLTGFGVDYGVELEASGTATQGFSLLDLFNNGQVIIASGAASGAYTYFAMNTAGGIAGSPSIQFAGETSSSPMTFYPLGASGYFSNSSEWVINNISVTPNSGGGDVMAFAGAARITGGVEQTIGSFSGGQAGTVIVTGDILWGHTTPAGFGWTVDHGTGFVKTAGTGASQFLVVQVNDGTNKCNLKIPCTQGTGTSFVVAGVGTGGTGCTWGSGKNVVALAGGNCTTYPTLVNLDFTGTMQ